jgi:hypothetical protein
MLNIRNNYAEHREDKTGHHSRILEARKKKHGVYFALPSVSVTVQIS